MSENRTSRKEKKVSDITSLARLLPHVWVYRKRMYLSVFFAALVAILWGLNLALAFPIIKVFFQGETIPSYVNKGIIESEEVQERCKFNIARLDERLEKLGNSEDSNSQRTRLLKDRARKQSKMSEATRNAWLFHLVKSHIIPWLPKDQFNFFAFVLGVLLLTTMLKGLCSYCQDVLVGGVVELTVMRIRKECFRKIVALDYQSISLEGTPALMSRFTYDMTLLVYGLRLIGGKAVREPLKVIVCVAGAFWISWQLTLLSVLFAPLAAIFFIRIGKKLKQATHRVMESMSRLYKTMEETFDGIKVLIAFNGASQHRSRFHRDNKSYFHKAMKIVRIDALTSPTTETMGFMAAFAALLPGAYLVLRGTTSIWGIRLTHEVMDIAQLSLLYVSLVGVVDPIRKLSTIYSKLKRCTAASERIFGMLDRKSLVQETADPEPMPRHQHSIEFRQIEFSYTALDAKGRPVKSQNVLDGIDLTIPAGEVVVVVGENGSGKSTLVNLLPRFYDPTHGTVLVDGVDIQNVRQRDLRKEIGVVAQETLLFDDTIYNNICYGNRSATAEEVQAAANQAHVTAFLQNKERFPDGMQTKVGDRGGQLSGGQRQRVALARAILCDPSVMILDEATSAIDAKSEQLIHSTLKSFIKGRTTFMITHSINQGILDLSPHVIVMDRGRVIAAGKHSELCTTCPIYQRLFQSQQEQQRVEANTIQVDDDFSVSDTPSTTATPTIFSIDQERKKKNDEGAA